MDATHIKLPTVPKYVDNVSRKIKSMVKRHAKMLPFTGNYIVENLFYIYLFKKYKMNCFMTQQSSGGVGKIGILIKIKESKDPIMQENIDSDAESLISCILEGEEIIVIPVSIMVDIAGFFGCHSNLLIYRRSFNQLEHFEPHGATFQGKHAEIINREIELYMTLLMEKINEHIDSTNSEMEQKLNIMTKAQLKMILVNSGLNGNGDKKKLVTIVVDSVAGASTKVEISADYDQAGYATQKAIIISKAMRKVTNLIGRERISLIFTNQLRTRMGVSFGDPWTTSGGKAIAFHSSCRIRLKQMGQLKAKVGGVDQVVGIKTRAQVVKNRMGPPLRSIDYDIYFDSGIDNYGSWLEMMKTYKLVNQSGAWYTYVDTETGEEIKFQAKNFEEMMESRPQLKETIYQKICDTYIMSYKESSAQSNIDNVELTDFDD